MNFVVPLILLCCCVFEGPFSPNSYVLQEIFLHYLCNNFLPLSLSVSYSKNISNSPPVFWSDTALTPWRKLLSPNLIPGKGKVQQCWLHKMSSFRGQSALSAIALSSQSRLQGSATAHHLHNQAESGFPVHLSPFFLLSFLFLPLFSSFVFLIPFLYHHLICLFHFHHLPFPLNFTIYLYSNPTNHDPHLILCPLTSSLCRLTCHISYGYKPSILEWDKFICRWKLGLEVGLLWVAAPALQCKSVNSGSILPPTAQLLMGPQGQEHRPLGLMPTKFVVEIPLKRQLSIVFNY